MSDLYRHPDLSISASAAAWRAMGYTVYTNSDVVGGGPYHGTKLLLLALAAGKTGDEAIAWALAEEQRRNECQALTSALASQAQASADLAAAIRGSAQSEVLERILAQLSERTQYAVRQQLKERGVRVS